MQQLSPEKLIRAGVHFGHDTSRWNPKMEKYIFSARNKIHIIDIRETIRGLVIATEFIKNVVANGEDVLFVGTKYQARELIRRKAQDKDVPYVVDRWLGGTLTNFSTIRSRLDRLEEIEQWEEDGTIELYSKKEQASIMREKRKLIRNLGGIRSLQDLPGALVVVDPLMEEIAVSEANRKDIPIVALIDTDGDPDNVDIPIPCNDEAMRVIDLMMDRLIGAVEEGREKQAQIIEEQRQRGEDSKENVQTSSEDESADTEEDEEETEKDESSEDKPDASSENKEQEEEEEEEETEKESIEETEEETAESAAKAEEEPVSG